MEFVKLVKNELIKILKRKVVYIFAIFAILSIILSCVIVYMKKQDETKDLTLHIMNLNTIEMQRTNLRYELANKDTTEYDKKVIEKKLEIYDYIVEHGIDNIINAEYKNEAHTELFKLYEKFYSIDEKKNKKEYEQIENNISRLWKIFESGTFEEYMEFKKDLIKQDYDKKIISEKLYKQKIETEDEKLKYEMGKYLSSNINWKKFVIMFRNTRESALERRIDDDTKKKYVDDEDIEGIENQILLAEYRLMNNKAPYFSDSEKEYDIDSYSRYTYNNFANSLSIMCIGLLVIILASSTISDELSKGTIKFALIAPYGRCKLLLAKIVSLLIITVVMVVIISQISVIFGNIVFGSNTNEYLYVKNSKVQIMNTYTYETLQYLLRIPELIIYLLIGLTLSSLTKNTQVSTIITAAMFIGFPILISKFNQFMTLDFVRYLPFTNFNFIDKVLHIDIYVKSTLTATIYPTSIGYSIFSLSVTAILLIITVFDSFRKKQI